MPYNNLITRDDVNALIPEQISNVILTNLQTTSAALSLFRRVPMSTAQTRMPVLAALPTAYWIDGDTGQKQTTEMAWANKYLNAEEMAVIVPIPEKVLDDANFDIWGSVRPNIEAAMGRLLDVAVFFGTNKPASWPTAIVPAAIAAGNEYDRGTATAAAGGIAEDLNQLFALVEDDGFDPNGLVANRRFRARLRGARATDGQRLLDISNDTVEGIPIRWSMPGLWGTATGDAEAIAGDFTQAIIGTRQDFTYKILDQAVIQDENGNIVYNLAQQDMVALRVVARFAFQVANTMTYEQAVEANRYPFAVLRVP